VDKQVISKGAASERHKQLAHSFAVVIMACANTSLPVPVSPSNNTVAPVGATFLPLPMHPVLPANCHGYFQNHTVCLPALPVG